MIPGMGAGMDPRQLSMMMKKFGIDVQDIPDVQEVVIRTPARDYVFRKAAVSVMKAQGVETWQVSGKPDVEDHAVRLAVSEGDVRLVMEQAGCDEAAARTALEASGGDIAEAIVKLSG